MSGFLVESALLTHGLASISDDRIAEVWHDDWNIAWLESGALRTGSAEEFIPFRNAARDFRRINYFTYDEACRDGWSGPLTASGTMRACELTGCSIAVTCGIGGLRTGQDAEASNDIRSLSVSDVSMIATAFKDMFDTVWSVRAAQREGVDVFRLTEYWHDGFMFRTGSGGQDAETPGRGRDAAVFAPPAAGKTVCGNALFLNPVRPEFLITDTEILEQAVKFGKQQAAEGKAFHPAVNSRIDELTGGRSSSLQLQSLTDNINLAQNMTVILR